MGFFDFVQKIKSSAYKNFVPKTHELDSPKFTMSNGASKRRRRSQKNSVKPREKLRATSWDS